MTKAEEQALKAYPKRGWKCKDADGNDVFLDGNRECRLAYTKGYEQATKDLMKDAIEGEIIGYPKDIKGSFVRFPVYALKEVAHFPINGKVGDKVKVIIIKE